MYRTLFCIVAAVLLCAPVGCRSCAHPFDYCGPTFTGAGCGECDDSCGPCDPNSRAGSILVAGGEGSIPGSLSPEPAPESAPLLSPERSDRSRLDESMLPSSGVQLIAEQEASKPPILRPRKSSSSKKGWMARKSRTTYR